MLNTNAADDACDHLGMSLQEPHLKFGELVDLAAEVVYKTDDFAGDRIKARDNVQAVQ